jgi:biotin-[acetyl-CoA-carboxylase] ligase BirA-like protein
MRVALRGADRHARGFGDLFERVAERILQEHDLRLLRRHLAERGAKLAAKLGDAGVARRIVVRLKELAERLVHASPPALDGVEAGVHDEPVQPGRELRAAPELLQPDAHLRERFLCSVVSVVRVTKDVARKPFHLRLVPGEQRLERLRVAVLGARHEHGVAQLVVGERLRLPQRLRDRVSHRASLVLVSDLSPEAIVPLLHGRLGKPYKYVESCRSTQRLVADDDPEGATVVTDHQTAGRGRLGRTWEDVPGRSILMSVLLRPPAPMPLWPELSLVAGGAVAAALRELGVDASLRHPNDVVVAGRKLVGVLPEASQGRVVLGIGVNVNQAADELPVDTVKPPTSVRIELGREVERAPLLAAILAELEQAYDAWAAPYGR